MLVNPSSSTGITNDFDIECKISGEMDLPGRVALHSRTWEYLGRNTIALNDACLK